jgi:hypothetical protein
MIFRFLKSQLMLLVLLFGLGLVTQASAQRVQIAASDIFEFHGIKGILAPRELAKQIVVQCSRPAPDPLAISDYWTPTAEQVKKIELAMPNFRKGIASAMSDMSEFRRIYAGITLQGRKVIYIDFAPLEDFGTGGSNWKRYLGGVCDGGPRFFGVEYEVETGTFSNLAFNGMV